MCSYFLIQFKCAHNVGSQPNFAPNEVRNNSLVVLSKNDGHALKHRETLNYLIL
jgi:hypothetical protein